MRSRALRAVLALVVFFAAAAPGLAARLPDWAKPIAASAPPATQAEGEDGDYRVLFRERRIIVDDSGHYRVRERVAKQALTPHANDEIGFDMFFVGDGGKVLGARSWHRLPDGDVERTKRRETFDIVDTSAFLADSRARTIGVDRAVLAGSLVFHEFEARWRPYAWTEFHIFASGPRVLRSRFIVEVPNGWEVHHQWLGEGPEPRSDGTHYTWELTDLVLPDSERLGRKRADRAPRLNVSFWPPNGEAAGISGFRTWADMGVWYERLSKGMDSVNPAIEARAGECGPAGAEDFWTTVQACGEFARDDIRYVAHEIGIGGYRPRPAGETLESLWGDCKDKAFLLRALLGVHELRSFPVLVNMSLRRSAAPEVACLGAFNHAILGVHVPDGVELPERFETAMIEEEGLGRVLILDPTDTYTSVGSISSELAGAPALLVAGEASRLTTLPGRRSEDHRIERRLVVTLDGKGGADYVETTTRSGEPAWRSRRSLASSEKKHREYRESRIHELWPGAVISNVESVRETAEGHYVETLRFHRDRLDRTEAGLRVSMLPGASHLVPRVPLRRRKTGVHYAYPRTVVFETELRGFTGSFTLPEAKHSEGDGWHLEVSWERSDDGHVRARLEFVLERTDYGLDETKTLKSLYRALKRAGRLSFDMP